MNRRLNVLLTAFRRNPASLPLLIAVFSIAVLSAWGRWSPPANFAAMMAITLAAVLACVWLETNYAGDPFDVDSSLPDMDYVDPWELQRELMAASDQYMPDRPMITNTSLMYSALIAEEGGEQMEAMAAIVRSRKDALTRDVGFQQGEALAYAMEQLSAHMRLQSKVIRKMLEGASFAMPITLEEARPVFDGVTDVVVVAAGGALACGFDGAAGYAETVGSNLSKRNPDTGKIDKTPDGKWIKGPDYQEPDLIAVMKQTAKENAPAYHPV
jgi:hypothetical protein